MRWKLILKLNTKIAVETVEYPKNEKKWWKMTKKLQPLENFVIKKKNNLYITNSVKNNSEYISIKNYAEIKLPFSKILYNSNTMEIQI